MREVFNTLVAVTFVLMVVFFCQQMVRYLNYVSLGKVPIGVFLKLSSFEIPYLLALLLPLGLYLGILLAFGRLYADNEIAILQICGFKNEHFMRLTIVVTIFVTAFVLWLMLWVNPMISGLRKQVMSSGEATLHLVQTLIPGRFQVSPDGRHVVFVEKLSRDRLSAKNVFLAEEKQILNNAGQSQNNWMLVLASSGYQTKDKQSGSQFFVTTDGYRYEGVPGQNDYKIIQYKKYAVRIPENNVRITHDEDEELSTLALWQEYNNPGRAAELQWRISIGISTFLLALLAVPMSSVQPRKGRYLALLPAILVYIVYIHLMFIARHWVVRGVVPISIGMWWVHGLVVLFILATLGLSKTSFGRMS
jgi:lipopolysaccharide export system permease protein